MNEVTLTQRDSKNVKSKIEHIERTWRKAHDFATSVTGAGLKDNDEGKFEDLVKKKCPYYYDLLEIMQDRASSKPKLTSYEAENIEDDLQVHHFDIEDSDDDDAISEMESEDGNDEDGNDDGIGGSVVTSRGGSVVTSRSGATSRGTKRSSPPSEVGTKSKGDKSSSTKKPRAARKNTSPLVDDDTIMAMNDSNRAAEKRLSEMQRHNQALEEIERARYDLEKKREDREASRLELEKSRLEADTWRSKSDQLEYQVNLINKYHEIKKKFNWSDQQILKHFPNMATVIDNEADSDSS